MTTQPAPLRDDQPVPVCALRNYARLNKQPAPLTFGCRCGFKTAELAKLLRHRETCKGKK